MGEHMSDIALDMAKVIAAAQSEEMYASSDFAEVVAEVGSQLADLVEELPDELGEEPSLELIVARVLTWTGNDPETDPQPVRQREPTRSTEAVPFDYSEPAGERGRGPLCLSTSPEKGLPCVLAEGHKSAHASAIEPSGARSVWSH